MGKNWCLTYWSHSLYYIWTASQPNQTKWHLRPAKTQINLGICPVWLKSSLSTWGKLKYLAIIRAQAKPLVRLGGYPGWSESSLGAKVILLVLSWGSSFYFVSLAYTILISAISRRFISWNSQRKRGFYVSMHMYVSVYYVILQTSSNTHLFLSRWSTRLTVHIARKGGIFDGERLHGHLRQG